MIFKRFVIVLLSAALAATVYPSTAAEERADGPYARAAETEIDTAPVEIDGSIVFRVRGVSSYPAEKRAAAIKDGIEGLARSQDFRTDMLKTVESEDRTMIMAGDQMIVGVLDADASLEGVNGRSIDHFAVRRTVQNWPVRSGRGSFRLAVVHGN